MRKLNVTDRQTDGRTDGGRCNISVPGLRRRREIIINASLTIKMSLGGQTIDNKFHMALSKVGVSSNITLHHLFLRKSYLVTMCTNSCEKFSKGEIKCMIIRYTERSYDFITLKHYKIPHSASKIVGWQNN